MIINYSAEDPAVTASEAQSDAPAGVATEAAGTPAQAKPVSFACNVSFRLFRGVLSRA